MLSTNTLRFADPYAPVLALGDGDLTVNPPMPCWSRSRRNLSFNNVVPMIRNTAPCMSKLTRHLPSNATAKSTRERMHKTMTTKRIRQDDFESDDGPKRSDLICYHPFRPLLTRAPRRTKSTRDDVPVYNVARMMRIMIFASFARMEENACVVTFLPARRFTWGVFAKRLPLKIANTKMISRVMDASNAFCNVGPVPKNDDWKSRPRPKRNANFWRL
jgi:hypothetical protein